MCIILAVNFCEFFGLKNHLPKGRPDRAVLFPRPYDLPVKSYSHFKHIMHISCIQISNLNNFGAKFFGIFLLEKSFVEGPDGQGRTFPEAVRAPCKKLFTF